MNTATQIAREFSKILRETLSAYEMALVIERNKLPDYKDTGSCASHDFCDANIPMAEAFEEITEEEFDAQKQEHVDLWNEAWRIAKETEFTF